MAFAFLLPLLDKYPCVRHRCSYEPHRANSTAYFFSHVPILIIASIVFLVRLSSFGVRFSSAKLLFVRYFRRSFLLLLLTSPCKVERVTSVASRALPYSPTHRPEKISISKLCISKKSFFRGKIFHLSYHFVTLHD